MNDRRTDSRPFTTPRNRLRCRVAGSTVTLSGELDALTARTVDEAFRDVERNGDVEVDVASVTFVDAAGLHALLRARAELDRDGRELHLVHPTEQMIGVLKITGLDERFAMIDGEADSEQSTGAPGCGRGPGN